MYISYSGFKLFLECRRAYLHRYVLKTPVPKPSNRVHMLYGDAVGKLFETFYVERLWRKDPLGQLLSRVLPTMERIVAGELQKGGIFNWKEKDLKEGTRSFAEVENEVRMTIPTGLASIRQHRLLGNDAAAEVVLDVQVGEHKLAGRADFLMRRIAPHGDQVLIDGKGSRWRGKYTNPRQLRWYAMLHWMKHGTIPDRVGFLYWRSQPEESLDWSTVTLSDVQELKNSVLAAIGEIEAGRKGLVQLRDKTSSPVFWPSPGNDCKLCDYLELCPEGKKGLSKDTKNEMAEALRHGVEDGEVSF
jgi:hypothetical protein